MVTNFNREEVTEKLLSKLSEIQKERLTIDDVGIEAVRLNYDEVDLNLIPDEIIALLPLWVVIYMLSIGDLVGYAVVDDGQKLLYSVGIMRAGCVISYL